jgi:RND superfamily putative drug exporter
VSRFAELVLRHRRVVGLLWILLFVAGAATAGQLSNRLTLDFSLPGQPGYQTEQQLVGTFGQIASNPLVAVVTVPPGETVAADRAKVGAVFDTVRRQVPQVRVVDYASTGGDPRFVTGDGRSTYGLVFIPQPQGFGPGVQDQVLPALRQAGAAAGVTVGLTGEDPLAEGSSGGDSGGPSILSETLVGAIGALAVLAFVFASFLALVPLIIAAVSILTTFLIVLGLTTITDVSFVVEFLIALVGLGVAIDYSLLLVNRWREERVPLLRSMGLGGMLIPLVSVAVVLTLLPVLLIGVGRRMDWPKIRQEATAARGWTAWARGIVRFRWPAVAVALGLLGLLISPVFGLSIGQANSASLATSGPAYEALHTLRDGGVGTGVLTPIEVLTRGDGAATAAAAARVDGVLTAVVGGSKDGLTVVEVVPRVETVDSTSIEVVDRVHDAMAGTPGFVGIAGAGATVQDYFRAVYHNFPYVLGLIAVITYILLVRTFRSLLLPLKAVALNLVSVGAVFGAVVFFWQHGHGSEAIFGISATGAVAFWLPVLIFAFLFGLSMDYEVFILSRMREEYDATGSTSVAVVAGLGRTGRLVTSAALILFFAFAALASAPGTDIKLFATALGVGILIDATLVRALLVPALVSVLGRWNWWLPAGVARVLRVEPSPLAPKPSVLPAVPPAPPAAAEPIPVHID